MSRLLKKARAFTLIELLVVIVIIGILAMFLVPAVTKAIRTAKVTGTANNGKQLYTLLFTAIDAKDQPGIVSLTQAYWPKTKPNTALGEKQFKSSSEYFADLLVSNVIDEISYPFFAEDKIDKAKNEQELRDESALRNAWCIALDVSDRYRAGAPVLFTQNFKFTGGAGANVKMDTQQGLEPGAEPYGDLAAVVVHKGGSAMKLDGATAITNNFMPTAVSNSFLWPLSSGQYITQ